MFNIVIPARFGSTRLPGKALLPIADKPMVAWVWERAMQADAEHVVVATDDQRIVDEMTSRGAQVAMTRADHASGTDRLAEVVDQLEWADDAIVVNLQGDEPLMPVANIQRVAAMLDETAGADMATLMEPLAAADADQQSVVKVVSSEAGRALYFSRSAIPFHREGGVPAPMFRHIGLYAYRAGLLQAGVGWPAAAPGQTEPPGPLRALAHDAHIQIESAPDPVPAGVDTESDLAAVRALLGAEQ